MPMPAHGAMVHAGHAALAHLHALAHGAVVHHHAPAGELGVDLMRIAEGEVVEHDHHFLLVTRGAVEIADDQRRGQQALFLQAMVGMHPEGAGALLRKVIVIGLARRQQRLRQTGDAVLRRRRRQAMPMDQRLLAHLILQPYAERSISCA